MNKKYKDLWTMAAHNKKSIWIKDLIQVYAKFDSQNNKFLLDYSLNTAKMKIK